ncbi:MAG: hypothetical protein ACRDBP_01695, partial [Luteolibacter sp.]
TQHFLPSLRFFGHPKSSSDSSASICPKMGSGDAFQHFHQFFQLGLKLGILAGGDHQTAHRTMVPHAQPFRNPAVCHRRSFSQQGRDQHLRPISFFHPFKVFPFAGNANAYLMDAISVSLLLSSIQSFCWGGVFVTNDRLDVGFLT